MKQLVSIIIPCYNYAHFLPEALESILAQTYTNWEVLVIDDGSTDATREIVHTFQQKDSRFKYIYQQNAGQAAARNTGLERARGEYIQFLDADDLIESEKIKTQVAFLSEKEGKSLVYSTVRYFVDSRQEEHLLYSREPDNIPWVMVASGSGNEIINYFLEQNSLELGSILFSRQAINSVGFFDKKIRGVEDWDYCTRCALADVWFYYNYLGKDRVLMRHHPISFSKNWHKMLEAEVVYRTALRERISGDVTRKAIFDRNEKILIKKTEILGREMIGSGKISKGLVWYWHAGKLSRKHAVYIKRAFRALKYKYNFRH
jgi:glycosyltransferase involved in cell wall biosynthesis